MAVRSRDIALAEIKDHIVQTRGSAPVHIPQLDLCRSASVLARPDGMFVIRIKTDPNFPVDDIDELGWVVSSIAKTRLGHVHDVHRASSRRTKSLLTPSQILIVYPVRIEDTGWANRFRRQTFTDDDLKSARCVLLAKVPPNTTPRTALVALRRAYLKVFENLSGRLAIDRSLQSAWQSGPWRLILAPLGLGVIAALYAIIVEWPASRAEFLEHLRRPEAELVVAAVTIVPAVYLFVSNLALVMKWDTPRIQLLRSAVLFYEYASPLNRVIHQITKSTADGFHDVITVLKTKTEGEVHRTALHQTWLTLALGFAGLMFAALAIRGGQVEAKPTAAPPDRVATSQDRVAAAKPAKAKLPVRLSGSKEPVSSSQISKSSGEGASEKSGPYNEPPVARSLAPTPPIKAEIEPLGPEPAGGAPKVAGQCTCALPPA